MSLNEPLSLINPTSIPGKVYVLGEYAALSNKPVLIATLSPRFKMGEVKGATQFVPHPQSPAGRLLVWARAHGLPELPLAFEDPYDGAGGFGASTAQFALAYERYAKLAGFEPSAIGARKLYKELLQDEGVIPSGADLVAQWTGGVVWYDAAKATISSAWKDLDWHDLMVFSAVGQSGRKIPTHEHLATLLQKGFVAGADNQWLPLLEKVLHRARFASTDSAALGPAMNEYADLLHNAGLELPVAHEDRKNLAGLPGVSGVKGTGALLADAVILLMKPGSAPEQRAEVIRVATSRGLVLTVDGIAEEQPGVV